MMPTISFTARPAALLVTALTVLLTTPHVYAQRAADPGVFLDLHGGVQRTDNTLTSSTTFPLYGETGGIATRQQPGAGPMFDVRAGYRATQWFGAAVSISGAQATYTGEVAANIPSPLLVSRPTSVSLKTESLTRREIGYHLQALAFVPVSDRIELTLAAGPSFVRVQQPVTRASVAAGTQALTLATTKNTEIVPALRVGADATVTLTPRFGVGAFVHYTTGKKDFADIAGVRVTSVQAGGGLRIWF